MAHERVRAPAGEGNLKVDVPFPKVMDEYTFLWAGTAIDEYTKLPAKLQEKYAEDAKELLNKGLSLYKSIEAALPTRSEEYQKHVKELHSVLIKFQESLKTQPKMQLNLRLK